MRAATKSSLYRHEVTHAAVACVMEALARIEAGKSEPLIATNLGEGRFRGPVPPERRMLEPERMTAEEALAIIRASDGDPGAGLMLGNTLYWVFNAKFADSPAPSIT